MNQPLEPNLAPIDLEVLFAADKPPAHDADFVVSVMRQAARRKMVWDLAGTGLVAALSALVLWALGPVLLPVLRPVSLTLLMFMPVIATVLSILVLVHPRAVI